MGTIQKAMIKIKLGSTYKIPCNASFFFLDIESLPSLYFSSFSFVSLFENQSGEPFRFSRQLIF